MYPGYYTSHSCFIYKTLKVGQMTNDQIIKYDRIKA